jgi:hypothetical protein
MTYHDNVAERFRSFGPLPSAAELAVGSDMPNYRERQAAAYRSGLALTNHIASAHRWDGGVARPDTCRACRELLAKEGPK